MPRIEISILCSIFSSFALAAPPPTLKPAPATRGLAEGFHVNDARATNLVVREQLDLRPPAAGEFATLLASRSHGEATANNAAAGYQSKSFPAARKAEDIDENPLSSMGAGASQSRVMGRAEAFAQRFHREGLPIARLWENHSALVSLGLNQKGKPGLWLVQKTH